MTIMAVNIVGIMGIDNLILRLKNIKFRALPGAPGRRA